eukprot:gene12261-15407_t
MASVMMKSSTQLATRGAKVNVASRRAIVTRAGRDTWYPGAKAPEYLDGSMAGDRGFDPLQLGENPDTLQWLAEAEKTNGRWAMMAVAGILFTDAVGLPKFWLAGAESYPIDNKTLAIVEVGVIGALEAMRYNGFKATGKSGALGMYPFDPMGMASPVTSEKEVKNARLAMLAFVGFCSQAAVQGKGPIQCLTDHLADPNHNNIFTSIVGPESVCTVVALSLIPMLLEVTKNNEEALLFPWSPKNLTLGDFYIYISAGDPLALAAFRPAIHQCVWSAPTACLSPTVSTSLGLPGFPCSTQLTSATCFTLACPYIVSDLAVALHHS